MDIRNVAIMFTKLRRISPHCARRWICSTLYNNSDSKIIFNKPPSTDVFENSSVSSEDLMQNPKMPFLLDVTSKLGIRVDNLISCLKISPELFNEPPIIWENCFKELKGYGFSKKKFMRMITMYPPLFKMVENEEFSTAMANWMNCQLGYDNMLDLLATQPQFLSIPTKQINARIPLLKSIAKSDGKNVVRLLRGCPSLMYQDLRNVKMKIDYLENDMKIDITKENLSKCFALNRTLDEIRIRHIFLERAGIFVKPPRKVKGTKLQQMQQPWSKNPRLALITDTSDEIFISEVATGLSLEELEVFKEMYREEIDEESGSDIEDN